MVSFFDNRLRTPRTPSSLYNVIPFIYYLIHFREGIVKPLHKGDGNYEFKPINDLFSLLSIFLIYLET